MANFSGNPRHRELLIKGLKTLHEWKKEHPSEYLNLNGVNLSGKNLNNVDLGDVKLSDANLSHAVLISSNFSGAALSHTDLSYANLSGANLSRTDLSHANLNGAKLRGTDLRRADLSGAKLIGADLHNADLHSANLSGAIISSADLRFANLIDAKLRGTKLDDADLTNAKLRGTDFLRANLNNTIFTQAILRYTYFVGTDLSLVKGLETCRHLGPCAVDISILGMTRKLPRSFLQGIGLPDEMIDYLPDFFENAVNFYSLFISYSTKDEEFANQLYHDLQIQGVRCWYSPEDIKGGEFLYTQIDSAIHLHDRLLLILSEDSMNSNWVITELTTAVEREKAENRRVLFPIRLVDFDAIKKWKVFDTDESTDLAKEVRKYFIPDFSNPDQYQESFARLIRDLRAKEAA